MLLQNPSGQDFDVTSLAVTGTCVDCKKIWSFSCDKPYIEHYWMMWIKGEYLQKAFAEFQPEEREFLRTSLCPPCWDKKYGEEK